MARPSPARLAAALALCAAPLCGGAAAAQAPDPAEAVRLDVMDTVSVRAPDLSAFPRWQAALAAVEPWLARMAECIGSAACDDLKVVEKVWLNRVQGLARLPPEKMARAVAAFLDDLLDIQPQDHAVTHSGPWPTMREILAGQSRDGLTLALARYYTMRAAGVAAERLRVVMARDTLTLDSTYVVLVATDGAHIAMTRYGVDTLTPSDAHGFIPIYAFNHVGRWLYFPQTALDRLADPTSE